MSSQHETTAAQRIAERLSFAVRRVAELDGLSDSQSVEVQWSAPLEPGEVSVSVHGCEPAYLLTLRTVHPDAREHVDADEILRWVEVDLGGVQATFYRR